MYLNKKTSNDFLNWDDYQWYSASNTFESFSWLSQDNDLYAYSAQDSIELEQASQIFQSPFSTTGINVTVFDNGSYVDTTSGGASAESDNVQASLAGFGHAVSTFTSIVAADIITALSGQDVLAVPELENGDWIPDTDATAALANFVSSGGTLIKFGFSGDNAGFLNAVFGFSVIETNASASTNQNVAGSPFADGPATLPNANGTDGLTLSSLPPGAIVHYLSGTSIATVVEIPFGSGSVFYLGYDWFNAAPTGSQDGGWLDVLNTASSFFSGPLNLVADQFEITDTGSVSGDLFADNGNGADTHDDGLTLSISEIEGVAADVGQILTLASGATVTINANGTFSYIASASAEAMRAGETLVDTIVYTVTDGAESRATSLTVTVNGEDRFSANDDIFATDDVTPLAGSLFDDNGNGADTHFEGGTMTVTEVNGIAADVGQAVTLASGVILTINADGTFSYVQPPEMEQIPEGTVIVDTVTYTVSDGIETTTATFEVTITTADNDDYFRGTNSDDTILAGLGNDTVFGRDGNDTLYGGDGEDVIFAGSGDDMVFGGSGNDNIRGNEGNDILNGNSGDDVIRGITGTNELYGGTGNDTLIGGDGIDLLMGGDGVDELNGGLGIDTLYGGDGNDTLLGGDQNDLLFGDAGDDTIYAGTGNDEVNGGTGDDFLRGGDGEDTIYGGDDVDTIAGGNNDDTLYGDAGGDFLNGGRGFDTLYGGLDNDDLRGSIGDDWLYGGDGDDVVHGGRDFDRLYGENGNDLITGGTGDDRLFGGEGNDKLLGGRDFDRLDGGAGDDFLNGGLGNDILTGGEGSDVFLFRNQEGDDTITDFAHGVDLVRVADFGTGFDSFSEMMTIATQQGTDVVFNFGQGDILTIENTLIADFTADDFGFFNSASSAQSPAQNSAGLDPLAIVFESSSPDNTEADKVEYAANIETQTFNPTLDNLDIPDDFWAF